MQIFFKNFTYLNNFFQTFFFRISLVKKISVFLKTQYFSEDIL